MEEEEQRLFGRGSLKAFRVLGGRGVGSSVGLTARRSASFEGVMSRTQDGRRLDLGVRRIEEGGCDMSSSSSSPPSWSVSDNPGVKAKMLYVSQKELEFQFPYGSDTPLLNR